MREQLAALDGQRLQVRGTFARYGFRQRLTGVFEHTILLEGVALADGGAALAEHVWMAEGARFAALGTLAAGDVLTFRARVKPYTKRRVIRQPDGHIETVQISHDYTLGYPSKIHHVPAAMAERSA